MTVIPEDIVSFEHICAHLHEKYVRNVYIHISMEKIQMEREVMIRICQTIKLLRFGAFSSMTNRKEDNETRKKQARRRRRRNKKVWGFWYLSFSDHVAWHHKFVLEGDITWVPRKVCSGNEWMICQVLIRLHRYICKHKKAGKMLVRWLALYMSHYLSWTITTCLSKLGAVIKGHNNHLYKEILRMHQQNGKPKKKGRRFLCVDEEIVMDTPQTLVRTRRNMYWGGPIL